MRRQRVLVEEGAEGEVELGELAFEGRRAFEEGFDTDGPKLLIIGCGIGVEEGAFTGLHAFENGAGHGREFGEPIVKGVVAAVLDREIDVGERMGHLVESDVLAIGVVGELTDKMGPGEIDAILADMAFEGHIIESVAVLIL